MANQPRLRVDYGFSQALNTVLPLPIAAKRAPTVNDTGYQLGQIWIYVALNAPYILTSVVAGVATWQLIEASGGSGVFSSLTVTPGPVSLTGTTGINVSGAGVTTINTGGTGALNLGNATGNTAVTGSLSTTTSLSATTTVTSGTGITATTGNIVASAGNINATLGSMSAGTTVTAGTGVTATTGNVTASAGSVSATATGTTVAIIGNTAGGTGATATLTSSGPTVDALQLVVGGLKVPVTSSASGASPRVVSARFGTADFTDVINAAATVALTITNTMVTSGAKMIFQLSCSTAGSALVVRDYVSGSGTVAVNVTNLGGTNTGADIFVTFWLLN